MKELAAVFLILLLFAACNNNKDACYLSVTLKNAPEQAILYLVDLDARKRVDSLQFINGKATLQLPIMHPKPFVIHNKRNRYQFRDRKYLWLEPGKIQVDGDFEFLKNLVVENSNSNDEYENYNSMVEQATAEINRIKDQTHFKTTAGKREDTLRIDSLTQKLMNDIVAFLDNRADSYVSLNTLQNESYRGMRYLNKQQIKSIYDKMPARLKETDKGREIKKYTELPDPPKVGDMAPDIAQVTPGGDTVKLSDYRGKYVWLDFWSSDCGPCRGAHPWLRRIYRKYQPYGFEILGVSGDSNKKRWTDAIQQDSLPWTNISDLKGWKNEAFLLYDVKFIPQSFLIDPYGKIIKWRIAGEYGAEYELGKIFEFGKKSVASKRRNSSSRAAPATEFPLSVELISFDGKQFNTSQFSNDNQMVFIDFWHLGCSPCMQFFDAVREHYDKWQQYTNCKIIAVACQERDEKIIQVVESANWPVEVYFDPDYKLFEALCRLHDKNDMQFSFPTIFVFDEQWRLLDKLKGAKRKPKDGVTPGPNKKITLDDFVVDLEAYFRMFREWERE